MMGAGDITKLQRTLDMPQFGDPPAFNSAPGSKSLEKPGVELGASEKTIAATLQAKAGAATALQFNTPSSPVSQYRFQWEKPARALVGSHRGGDTTGHTVRWYQLNMQGRSLHTPIHFRPLGTPIGDQSSQNSSPTHSTETLGGTSEPIPGGDPEIQQEPETAVATASVATGSPQTTGSAAENATQLSPEPMAWSSTAPCGAPWLEM